MKVDVVGYSLLNGINEKGFCKKLDVRVKNVAGATSETVLDETDTLIGQKSDCIIVYVGPNDIT